MVIRSLDYHSIPRINYTGAPPFYDAEIDISAFVPFRHDAVKINSFGETLDDSMLGAYSKQRAAAITQQMKNRIMAEEDAEIFKILDRIAKSGNNDI